MRVIQHTDAAGLARHAAELIYDDCHDVLAARSGDYTIGLSGGRTPILMFQALADLQLPWSRVQIFQVDERVAPADSDDRNWTQLAAFLVDRIDIPSTNLHPMPVEGEDITSACREYEAELERATGGRPLDMLQLGLGDDGHTASLAPGDPILEVADRAVWHVERFNGLPRMTMTYPPINEAKRLVWLAAGPAKAEMCRRLVAVDSAIPAGRVAQDNAVLLVDEAAAAEL